MGVTAATATMSRPNTCIIRVPDSGVARQSPPAFCTGMRMRIYCHKLIVHATDPPLLKKIILMECKLLIIRPNVIYNRSMFFSERVINVWNSLPCDVTNFSSVKAFKRSLRAIDLLTSALALFSTCFCVVVCLCFFVFLGIVLFRAVLSTIMLVSLSCIMLA